MTLLIHFRHDWYQTEVNVIVSILAKGVMPEDFSYKVDTKKVGQLIL